MGATVTVIYIDRAPYVIHLVGFQSTHTQYTSFTLLQMDTNYVLERILLK